MARVVYRGVSYDTECNLTKEFAYVKLNETYRGVDHQEIVKVEVRK